MNSAVRFLEDREYKWSVTINGLKVLPRYAFTSRQLWYDHLQSLGHKKINAALNKLYSVPKTSSKYQYLSDCLYEKLLDKLEEWGEATNDRG